MEYIYKKVIDDNKNHFIVTLSRTYQTRNNEKRSNVVNPWYAKYRANMLYVEDIRKLDPITYRECDEFIKQCLNKTKYGNVLYVLNSTVISSEFDDNIENICSAGIHYFKSKICAIMYNREIVYDGEYKEWSNNGQLQINAHYEKGLLNGIFQQFNEVGIEVVSATYKDGKRYGNYLERYNNGQLYIITTLNSSINMFTEFYESGHRKIVAMCKNNEFHGTYTEFYDIAQESGVKIETNYNDGKYHGIYKEWFANGILFKSINYRDDNKHGLYTEFYNDGVTKLEVNYKDNQRDGKAIQYFKNSTIKKRVNYAKGLLDGTYEEWYESGKHKKTLKYKNGIKVKCIIVHYCALSLHQYRLYRRESWANL
jgi:antitoxin component YwqK of YwqJK toxin-antitoxin module